ncbi:hypothetical protein Cni_G29372 [Canna indica]|uniref:FAF domain-containing protein n=1 Tax=Canna indica TaxID=4628 RepID=A0AAQ3LBI0_9LILI|nr:hypothetical protein Cni_G29372 [Canna indica]
MLIKVLMVKTINAFSSFSSFSSPCNAWAMKFSSPLPRSITNLDVCTEILGCETGVVYNFSDYNRDMRAGDQDLETTTSDERETILREREQERKYRKNAANFPPPLTVLSGEARCRIVSKRENGRLQLFCVRPTLMEARREDGSLKLVLLSGDDVELDREATTVEDTGNGGCKEEEGGGGCSRRNSDAKRLLQIDADAPLVIFSGPCSLTQSALILG